MFGLGWVLRFLGYRADARAVRNSRVGRRIAKRAGYRLLRKL